MMESYITNYLEKRVQNDYVISNEMYLRSILDITEFLWYQLGYHLDQENRLFGITVSYMNSITSAFKRANEGCTFEDCDIYGKTLYLYRPLIIKEYKRLLSKRLSKADCIIVIIKRIMEFLMSDPEVVNHKNYREFKTLDKIITKLFNNIRHAGKNSTLAPLINSMKKYKELGLIGKYVVDKFFLDEEATAREKTEFLGDKVKIENSEKLMEVEWTEKH